MRGSVCWDPSQANREVILTGCPSQGKIGAMARERIRNVSSSTAMGRCTGGARESCGSKAANRMRGACLRRPQLSACIRPSRRPTCVREGYGEGCIVAESGRSGRLGR